MEKRNITQGSAHHIHAGPLALLLAMAFALGTAACGGAPRKPPESPQLEARKDERIRAEEERELEHRHLAPPPAYGNRVVMAENKRSSAETF